MEGNDIFCKLYPVWAKLGWVIAQNEHAYSIYCVTPSNPGHALIMPRQHVQVLAELAPEAAHGFNQLEVATFQTLKEKHFRDSKYLIPIYEEMSSNPKGFDPKFAAAMLSHPHLCAPPLGRMVGSNLDDIAGRTVPHYHLNMFLQYDDKKKGIANAVREYLK